MANIGGLNRNRGAKTLYVKPLIINGLDVTFRYVPRLVW